MSRLIFLGTGSGNAVSRQLAYSGGFILQVDELQLHFDPGTGAITKAREFGVNLSHNAVVLVSHKHIAHCNELNAVIQLMSHAGLDRRGIILGSKSVVQHTEKSHPFLTRFHMELVEKVIAVEKKHKVGVELIEIHALPAQHTDPTAVGFKVFCPKFTLSYTGDTALTDELLQSLKGTDILIANVPYPGEKAERLNLDTASFIRMVREIKPKAAIMTHFGVEMLKADPLVEAREVYSLTNVPTLAAKDGLTITPESYLNPFRSPVKGYG